MLQVIGKVSATEKMPSTIDNFYFWTDKGQILSPFDIVKVEHVSSIAISLLHMELSKKLRM